LHNAKEEEEDENGYRAGQQSKEESENKETIVSPSSCMHLFDPDAPTTPLMESFARPLLVELAMEELLPAELIELILQYADPLSWPCANLFVEDGGKLLAV
jgi:hypothetical protein